jgi:hypothetical protein
MTTPQESSYPETPKPIGRGTGNKRGKYKVERHEVYQLPFKVDGVLCRLIPLTNGKSTIVDAADFEYLNEWNWTAKQDSYTKQWYAIRTVHDGAKHWTDEMHRVILGIEKMGRDVKGDHISLTDTLDNRRNNLRVATHGQNRMNSRIQRNNKTGCKGVSFSSSHGKYQVYIGTGGKRLHLAWCDTYEEAVQVRRAAAEKYHREFSRAA